MTSDRSSIEWTSRSRDIAISRPGNLRQDLRVVGIPFADFIEHGQELRLHRLRRAELVWWHHGVAVFDRDGRLVPELGFHIAGQEMPTRIRDVPPTYVEGLSASILHWMPRNYCHGLFESLPLIGALEESGLLRSVRTILFEEWLSPLLGEALSVYQTDPAPMAVREPGRAVFEELLAFGPPLHPAHKCHETFLRFFDRLTQAYGVRPGNRKIIIDRPRGRRGFENLAALSERLPEFEIVSLDDQPTLSAQAKLFAGARTIVAAHGASLANVAFCHRPTAIIEIFNRTYGTPAFWVMARAKGLEYNASFDYRGAQDYLEDLKYEDILIDLDDIERLTSRDRFM